jgi:acetylornithine deacetylase/succinyl-diaminopimelate desuccinylase-like protein
VGAAADVRRPDAGNVMPDYTETIRDLRAAVRKENDDARRETLLSNLSAFEREYREMKESITNLRLLNAVACSPADAKAIAKEAVAVLTERVEWHTWLLRAVILATIVQLIGGLIIAIILHGIRT